MERPAQRREVNSIENVWKLVNKRAKEKNPRNVEEQWTNLKKDKEKISVNKSSSSYRAGSTDIPDPL